jgi:hypothetical protein
MESTRAADHSLIFFYVCLAKAMEIECPFSNAQSANGQAEQWMKQVDTKVSPVKLRQFLHAETTKANELTFQALATRYRDQKSSDKLFIVVSEYLSRCTPDWFQDQPSVSMADVSDVLEPVLGQAGELPAWLPELEELITELCAYEHLHDLARHGIFDRGRKLKARVSAHGVDTMGLVAFARFNYVLRKTFTTLWDAELWWIEQALNELESRADFFVDCSEIGLSPIVPTNEVFHMVCEWKRPNFSDYATDLTYQKVQKVRQILEKALLPEMAD